jgi:hypothetical protein
MPEPMQEAPTPAPEGEMPNTTDATKPCRNHPHHCPGCGVVIDCDYICCATCTPKFCSPFTPTPAPASREHRNGYWCDDLRCAKCYSADAWLKSEVARLTRELEEAREAARTVCPDKSEDEDGEEFVCLGETGDPIIEANTVAEVIQQMSKCWEGVQEQRDAARAELAEARTEATRLREAGKQFAEEIEHGCLACCGDGCEGAHVDDTREAIATFRRALTEAKHG